NLNPTLGNFIGLPPFKSNNASNLLLTISAPAPSSISKANNNGQLKRITSIGATNCKKTSRQDILPKNILYIFYFFTHYIYPSRDIAAMSAIIADVNGSIPKHIRRKKMTINL